MNSKNFTVFTKKIIFPFNKSIKVDSDKSISIRSFLIASISNDISLIKNALESDDVKATISVLKQLGIKIIKKDKSYLVYGKGLGSFSCKKGTILDCQNSGTLSRLLIGILSTTQNIDVIIQGDHSLNKRNMTKLLKPMEEFGATFLPKEKKNFPLRLISSAMPIGIKYTSDVSAQIKSAVMLAGLNSFGDTEIIEKKKSRNHTEKFLEKYSNAIKIKNSKNKIIEIFGKKSLNNFKIDVPGDPSSAAFFVALAILSKKTKLKIKNVEINERRIGFYELLIKAGAKIKFKNIRTKSLEKVADLEIKSSKIKPINASNEYYVKTADEYPILCVIASLTKGISKFKGVADLVNKESNRILEMKKILSQIGVKCQTNKNEIKIFGQEKINIKNKIIKVPNLGDHRICMSTLILSLITGVPSKIKNFETVKTSSPNFLKIVKYLGGKFEIRKK